MTNAIRPLIPKGTHPIETGRYLLPTNPVNEMCAVVNSWINNRATGGICWGRPRIGKTRSGLYLQHDLKEQGFPVYYMCCNECRVPTESDFFGELLKATGHFITNGKAEVKRNRLHTYLYESAREAGGSRIIIILDEAQLLHDLQYGWLMNVYNRLDLEGITMTAILIGQKDLIHKRTALATAKRHQIIGRFMVHTHPFRGILSLEDMESCLEGYDTNSEYPENSGWSYTRFYFPDGYDFDGFRLKNYASDVFEVFKDLHKANGTMGKMEIPMQYLSTTVEYCLKNYGGIDRNHQLLGADHWRKAAIYSGFSDADIYIDAS